MFGGTPKRRAPIPGVANNIRGSGPENSLALAMCCNGVSSKMLRGAEVPVTVNKLEGLVQTGPFYCVSSAIGSDNTPVNSQQAVYSRRTASATTTRPRPSRLEYHISVPPHVANVLRTVTGNHTMLYRKVEYNPGSERAPTHPTKPVYLFLRPSGLLFRQLGPRYSSGIYLGFPTPNFTGAATESSGGSHARSFKACKNRRRGDRPAD